MISRGRAAVASAWLVALLVLSPILALVAHASSGDVGAWRHLFEHVLGDALIDTAVLLGGVGLIVTVVGTGAAYLVSAYRFPGSGVLSWALLLPLAVPTYIVAFAYLDVLHPIGPVQTALRALMGYESPRQWRLPDLRSMGGAIFVLGFVLYPYVYLSARAMFSTQAASLMEVARTLGVTRSALFLRVALPLARPAIVVGATLALLETLNDVGASEFLGVRTLTVSIYSTWVARSDLASAAQIALAMLVVVGVFVAIEQRARRSQRYASTRRPRPIEPERLRGLSAALALGLCATPVLLGFGIPALYLCAEAAERVGRAGISPGLWRAAANTVGVGAVASGVVVALGLLVAWGSRRLEGGDDGLARAPLWTSGLGYAIPGTVVAMGLLTPLGAVDALVMGALGRDGLWLMGSVGALLLAYTVRFVAISAGGVDAGLARISPSIERVARSLGAGPNATLRRVHLPILRPAIAASALLVFVDAMKELPATLLLRPVGFETLATALYGEAARGTYEEGAVAALAIVLAGIAPVIFLARRGARA